MRSRPEEPRLRYQLSRVLNKAGRKTDLMLHLQAAVDAGYPAAFAFLASRIMDGDTGPADPAKAIGFYEKALDGGFGAAAHAMGALYWDGDGGLAPDKAAAVSIWKRGAELGDPSSHERLAWVAELGRSGKAPDLPAALYHYAMAAQLADANGSEWPRLVARYRRATLSRNLDLETTSDVSATIRRAKAAQP